jgi:hypothetical protein
MANIYILVKVGEPQASEKRSKLEANLASNFPDGWRKLEQGSYLVASDEPLLTRDVSDKAGITNGEVGSYIVTKIDAYYGWAGNEIWEWINTHAAPK